MFYAFVHRYCSGVRDERGKRIGRVEVFPTKRTRDEFVSANEDNEAINAKTARVCLTDELLAERPYMYDEMPFLSMSEIVNEVRAIRCEIREG